MNPHNDFDSPSPSRGSAEFDQPTKRTPKGLPWPLVGVLVCIAGYWVYQLGGPREVFDPSAQTRELQAALIQQQAECKAEIIEFPKASGLHDICQYQVRLLAQQLQDEAQRQRR